MRTIRLLVASALTLSVAALVPAAEAAPTPPYTVFYGSDSPVGGSSSGAFVFEGPQVQVKAGTAATGIQFDGSPSDPEGVVDLGISPVTGESLVAGTSYQTSGVATDPGTASLDIIRGGTGCGSATGTLTITQLDSDADTGAITAFAAGYTFSCAGAAAISGVLRWNSDVPYAAVVATPPNWDFGSQPTKTNGTAKSFTVRNRGTDAVTFGTATLTGSKDAFTISKNTCSAHAIPAGATCTLTVVPHPQYAVSSTYSGSVNNLYLPAPGVPTLKTVLHVEGVAYWPIYAQGGPSRITFSWQALPGPVNNFAQSYNIYRGTSPSTLTYLRRDFSGSNRITDSTVTPGRTYYYSVRPVYTSGYGDLSPAVAAIAWPKYSAGMYHRLSSPVRFVSAHRVTAGHPYSLKILGQHGVPTSGVSAVALELLGVNPSKSTHVWVYPSGTHQPAASDLYVGHGATHSNFVLAKIGSGGRIVVSTSHGSTPVTVDVSGYYSASGLSTKYGTGAAMHEYVDPGVILDTRVERMGALPHGYYVDAPVGFDPLDTPHITSLVVQVTAYGSAGSGTIAGYRTNAGIPGTSVLAYSRNTTSTATAIISAGQYYNSNDGNQYPSVSFLNRGAKPVQLAVTIIGFYDDATFLYGERYVPSSPVHLYAHTLHTGSTGTVSPGSHAGSWTVAMNVKSSVSSPSATTKLSLWAYGISGVGAPAYGQLYANAHDSVVASTLQAVGTSNRFHVRNRSGTVPVNLWSFGRFDAYPVPSARSYALAGPSEPRTVQTARAPGRLVTSVRARPAGT